MLLCLTFFGSSLKKDFSPVASYDVASYVCLSFPVVLDNLVRTSRKSSGGWSKPFEMKFGEFVERLLQSRKTIMNCIATIILVVVEENMELNITCVIEPWNKIYFALFIIVPFIIILMLNFIIQVYFLKSFNVKKDKCCSMAWESSFPAWMWIVIVFLDGKYLQCALVTHSYESGYTVPAETISPVSYCFVFFFHLMHALKSSLNTNLLNVKLKMFVCLFAEEERKAKLHNIMEFILNS